MSSVDSKRKIVAASWMDAAAVNILSTPDSSAMRNVERKIGKENKHWNV